MYFFWYCVSSWRVSNGKFSVYKSLLSLRRMQTHTVLKHLCNTSFAHGRTNHSKSPLMDLRVREVAKKDHQTRSASWLHTGRKTTLIETQGIYHLIQWDIGSTSQYLLVPTLTLQTSERSIKRKVYACWANKTETEQNNCSFAILT